MRVFKKFIFASITALIISSTLFVAFVEAEDVATWTSDKTISYQNITYSGPERKSGLVEHIQTKYADDKYYVYQNSADCHLTNVHLTGVRWIIVDQENPIGTATYIDNCGDPTDSGYQPNQELTVQLLDPEDVAVPAVKSITVGAITGRVIPKDWSGTDPAAKVPKHEFGLYTKSGVLLGTFTPTQAADGKFNYSIAISETTNKKLLEGDYSIAFRGTEQGNYMSGDATDESTLTLGTFTFVAKMTFNLKAGENGEGIIKVTGDDQEEMDSLGDGLTLNELTFDNGINVLETYSVESPLDKAISNAIKWVAGFTEKAMQFVMSSIYTLLNETERFVLGTKAQARSGDSPMMQPWISVRNIGLSLLVMALIIIAFANVVQVDIEQYGLNRMIPRIIISLIMAYGSWVIVTFFFDLSTAIQTTAAGLATSDVLGSLADISIKTPGAEQIAAHIGTLIAIIVILLGVIACGIVLMFTLLIRIVMLSFLLVVAPLAFILNIVPFTANLYKQWWSEFFKWMFMGPIAMAIIALGSIIAGSTTAGGLATQNHNLMDPSVSFSQTGSLNIFIGLVIFAATLYMAATLPMQWGGSLMKSWAGIGKKFGLAPLQKAGGFVGGAAWDRTGGKLWRETAGGILKNRKALRHQREDLLGAERKGRVAEGGALGRFVTGASKQQSRALNEAIIANTAKEYEYGAADRGQLNAALRDPKLNNYQRTAIHRELASRGDYEFAFAKEGDLDRFGNWQSNGNLSKEQVESNAKRAAGNWLNDQAGKDQALVNSVVDKQAELAFAAGRKDDGTLRGPEEYGSGLYGRAASSWKKKPGYEKRPNAFPDFSGKELAKQFNGNDIDQIYGPKGTKRAQDEILAISRDDYKMATLEDVARTAGTEEERTNAQTVLDKINQYATASTAPDTNPGQGNRPSAPPAQSQQGAPDQTSAPAGVNPDGFEKTQSGFWIPKK